MIDLDDAREYLRRTLEDDIEITDPDVLDAAAVVLVNGKGVLP